MYGAGTCSYHGSLAQGSQSLYSSTGGTCGEPVYRVDGSQCVVQEGTIGELVHDPVHSTYI